MKRACTSGVSSIGIGPCSEKPADYSVTATEGRNMEWRCPFPIPRIHWMILCNQLFNEIQSPFSYRRVERRFCRLGISGLGFGFGFTFVGSFLSDTLPASVWW
jgi:hypothetical protein